MVPCQYLIGIFMLLLSYRVSEIMGDSNIGKFKTSKCAFVDVFVSAIEFPCCNSGYRRGWLGAYYAFQTAGFFLGNVVYLTLDSPDFANRFFRSEPKSYGLVSLAGEFHL
ncbi:unnamed protein product [Gongylonema pulchrum]|uniref:CASP-like protein n=1 Tax=Gongylonema pulchrum TaxID=637853 RepID=A0A183ERP4_9BILA|nr:unnamed protein product [Gongylonema pulchrum]